MKSIYSNIKTISCLGMPLKAGYAARQASRGHGEGDEMTATASRVKGRGDRAASAGGDCAARQPGWGAEGAGSRGWDCGGDCVGLKVRAPGPEGLGGTPPRRKRSACAPVTRVR